jgi:hypothetical protein
MWEDMVTYWAWRGNDVPRPLYPPTEKRLQYASLSNIGARRLYATIACVVCDDGVCRRINEGEIMVRVQQGWEVTFPEKVHELG